MTSEDDSDTLRAIDRRKQMLSEKDAEILQQAFVDAIKECAPLIIEQTMPLITEATTKALQLQFERAVGRGVVGWLKRLFIAAMLATAGYISLKTGGR